MKSLTWKVLSAGSAVMAALAADQALNILWRGATGNKPPTVPEDPETSMAEALGWAALSGAVIGLARMYGTRKAAAYYKRSTGELPKALLRK
jgi:Protein of unknown function (DUF4235)